MPKRLLTDEQKAFVYLKYGFVYRHKDDPDALMDILKEYDKLDQLPYEILHPWFKTTENMLDSYDPSYDICAYADSVSNLTWSVFDKKPDVAKVYADDLVSTIMEILIASKNRIDKDLIANSLETLNNIMYSYEN